MCQKVINVVAIASGVISLAVVGVGGYVYVNQDSIIESVKEKALGSLGGGLGGALSGGLALPDPAPGAPAQSLPASPF